MTTNPTPTRCTARPTGVAVARPAGFPTVTPVVWFHTDHKTAAAYTVIATYAHRRPGEHALH